MRSFVHAILLVLTCASCSSSGPLSDPVRETLPGTYALVSINGQALPYTNDASTTKSEVMTIFPNGKYSGIIAFRRPPGFEPPEGELPFSGVWIVKGDKYEFLRTSANSPLPQEGTLVGRTLTLRWGANDAVFQRQ